MHAPLTGRTAGHLATVTPSGEVTATALGTGAFARTDDHLSLPSGDIRVEPALVLRIMAPVISGAGYLHAAAAVEKVHLGLLLHARSPLVVLGSDIAVEPDSLDSVTAALRIGDWLASETSDEDIFDDPIDLLSIVDTVTPGQFLVSAGLCRPVAVPAEGALVTADFYEHGQVRTRLSLGA